MKRTEVFMSDDGEYHETVTAALRADATSAMTKLIEEFVREDARYGNGYKLVEDLNSKKIEKYFTAFYEAYLKMTTPQDGELSINTGKDAGFLSIFKKKKGEEEKELKA